MIWLNLDFSMDKRVLNRINKLNNSWLYISVLEKNKIEVKIGVLEYVLILNRVNWVVIEKVIFEWILEWYERMMFVDLGSIEY